MDITEDPRFLLGVKLFNEGEALEASDCFEELFFEGVRDEPELVRIFLQFSVGIHHAEMSQWRPAIERIEEGLRLIDLQPNGRAIDLDALARGMRAGVMELRQSRRPAWPQITLQAV